MLRQVQKKGGGIDSSNINAYSMGLERFVEMGVDVPQKHVREAFGLPEPSSGEPLLQPIKLAGQPNGATGNVSSE